MNATVWKPSSNISANTRLSSRYITTDPGVLNLVDDSVDVTLRSSDAQATVCVALGYAQDVSGWLAGSSYTRITGLDSWNTLAKRTNSASAGGDTQDAVAFQDSDMWTETKCGTGSVNMNISESSSRAVLIADTDAGADSAAEAQGTQQLTMNWIRTDLPDFAMPLYLSGGLLAALAVMTASVFAMEPERRRKREVEGHEEKEPEITVLQAFTGTLSPIGRSIRSAVKPKPKDNRHRNRKASEDQSADVQLPAKDEALGTPKIIDAGSKNMLADQQHSHHRHGLPVVETESADEQRDSGQQRHKHDGAGADTGRGTRRAQRTDRTSRRAVRPSAVQGDSSTDETTVISNDDLASYFARLSAEDKVPVGAQDKQQGADDNRHATDEHSQEDGQ
jgi:hypothetical protein